MPLTPFFSKLFHKPLVIVALMIMVILMGSYAAQYYIWSVSYQITPLTASMVVVDIGAHSGATMVPGTFYGGSQVNPMISITIPSGKILDVYVLIPHSALDQLEQHFYSIRIKIYAQKGSLLLSWIYDLVSGGHHYTGPDLITEPVSGLEGILPRTDGTLVTFYHTTGTWNFWFEVTNIWTGAVASSTGSVSFPIYVYATEA
jgi:hypothetical protein